MGGQTYFACVNLARPPLECGPCPRSCAGLDETACAATPGCSAQSCSKCFATAVFSSCYRTGDPPPMCPQEICESPSACVGMNETSCKARSGCVVEYCAHCSGAQVFAGCLLPNEPVTCPEWPCPAVTPCANVTDEATCEARTDCHAVFGKCISCDCPAPGCAVVFDTCADGAKASCKGPPSGTPLCQETPPDCDWTTPYVLSYTTDCYEGCVRPSECGP